MHVSLDQALGRQPRLNRVGQSLLNIASGASAAYSLRSLTGDDPDVVRIRRDADNEERDFSASEVASASALWVNGKQETTLPADVASAAAAYSLRKVRSAYTGNAVEIRRKSDNAEADVAFDSNDEVSTSSAITVTSGSSTATTLGDFLDEDVTYFDTTGATGTTVQGLPLVSGSNISVNYNASDGFGGDASFTFTGAGVSTNFDFNFYWNNTFSSTQFLGNGSPDKLVQIQAYIKRTNGNASDVISFREYATSNRANFDNLPLNEWKLVSGTISKTDEARNHIQISATAGTTFQLSLVKYTLNVQDAHVVTWYDQSGNTNDATQATAGSQPLIAESGTLKDHLDFDGVGDFMSFTDIDFTSGDFLVNATYAWDGTADSYIVADSDNHWIIRPFSSTGFQSRAEDGTQYNVSPTDHTFVSGEFVTTSVFRDGNTLKLSVNGSVDDTTNDVTGETFSCDQLGARTGVGYFGEGMKEVIIYTSDQSSNRFKIESNINNYYGIYTAAEDGFVATWYDQSGNGNDATQSTLAKQPKIVNAGSYLGYLQFTQGDATEFTADSPIAFNDVSFVFERQDATDSVYGLFSESAGVAPYSYVHFKGAELSVDGNISDTAQAYVNGVDEGIISNKAGVIDIAKNYVYLSFTTSVNDISDIGRLYNGSAVYGTFGGYEFVFWDSDETSKISQIETNVNGHYDIF